MVYTVLENQVRPIWFDLAKIKKNSDSEIYSCLIYGLSSLFLNLVLTLR